LDEINSSFLTTDEYAKSNSKIQLPLSEILIIPTYISALDKKKKREIGPYG
jgi:hypothetical protein